MTADGVVHAVNGVSFNLNAGEFLGVVGESGSGKSVTMMSLLKLIPMPPGEVVAGSAMFAGQDLLAIPGDEFASCAWWRDRFHLPRSDDVAEPGADDRTSDLRIADAPHRHHEEGSRRDIGRAAHHGRSA